MNGSRLTPAQTESMKAEIMEVIGRYVDVDQSCAEFKLRKKREAWLWSPTFP